RQSSWGALCGPGLSRGRTPSSSGGGAFGVLTDARERRIRDRAVVVDRRLKRGQPGRRLHGRLPRVDEPDAVAGLSEVEAGRRRRGLAHPRERSRDGTRVAEVVAHQPLDALLWERAGVTEDIGRALLQLMRQLVVIPLALEME